MSYVINLNSGISVRASFLNGGSPPTPPDPPTPPTPVSGNTMKFYHISDIHCYYNLPNGVEDSLGKSKQLMEQEGNDAAFTVFTGDYSRENALFSPNVDVSKSLYEGLINFKKDSAGNEPYDLLMVNGNHDAWSGFGIPPTLNSCKAATNYLHKVMGDKVVWGDKQNNWSYWYKDYSVPNKNAKLRIIGIDSYQYSATTAKIGEYYNQYDVMYLTEQIDWVVQRIKELKPEDYLLIALHEPPIARVRENQKTVADVININNKNSFTSYNLKGWWYRYNNGDVWPKVIHAYQNHEHIVETISNVNETSPNKPSEFELDADFTDISTPCTFLGYLCGHIHADICIPHPKQEYSNQLIMCVDCTLASGNSLKISDIPEANRPNGVLINEVTIDFENKRINIKRLGNNHVASQKVGTVTYPEGIRKSITFDFNANMREDEGL